MRKLSFFLLGTILILSFAKSSGAGQCSGCPITAKYKKLFDNAKACSGSPDCTLKQLEEHLAEIEKYKSDLGSSSKSCLPMNSFESTSRQLKLKAIVNGLFEEILLQAATIAEDSEATRASMVDAHGRLIKYGTDFLVEPFEYFQKRNEISLDYFDFEANKLSLKDTIAEFEEIKCQLEDRIDS